MKDEPYSRTVSTDEEKEGYFMILKDRLAFFPLVGRAFEMQSGRTVRRVQVESYRCECRGPGEPHEHYFVRWEDLHKGDRVLIQRDRRKAGRYVLQIRSTVAQQGFCG